MWDYWAKALLWVSHDEDVVRFKCGRFVTPLNASIGAVSYGGFGEESLSPNQGKFGGMDLGQNVDSVCEH